MLLDASAVAIVGVAVYLVSLQSDLFEKIVEFTRRYEAWELDEIIAPMIALACCLLVFAIRRWRDLVEETRRRGEALEKNEILIAELREALAAVKRLEGLIPICANCHSIRDDSGYWRRVDQYLQERTDALFSHSICPKCMAELYPDVYAEIKKKEEKE